LIAVNRITQTAITSKAVKALKRVSITLAFYNLIFVKKWCTALSFLLLFVLRQKVG